MSRRFSSSKRMKNSGEWIEALLRAGSSWADVADYFSEDVVFSGWSASRFSNEWSRLKKRGFVPDKNKVKKYLDEILVSGSIPRGRFVIRESAEPIAGTPASSVGSCAASRTWAWWAGFRPVWFCGEAVRFDRGRGAMWVVGG